MRTTLCLIGLAIVCSGCVRSVNARAENWWSAQSAHVRLETDTGPTRALTAVAELERLHHAVATAFYGCPGRRDEPVDVTLLGNEGEYLEIAQPRSLGENVSAIDGIVARGARVVLADVQPQWSEQTRTFSHEITHRFVHDCFPTAPVWLDEGLAQLFETVQIIGSRVLIGTPGYRFWDVPYAFPGANVIDFPLGSTPHARELSALAPAQFYSTRIDPMFQSVSARTSNYAGAWGLVDMLALGPNPSLRARFLDYLRSLNEMEDSSAAFAAAFAGVDLDRALETYLRANRYRRTSRDWDGGRPIEPLLRPMSPPEAHVRRAELWLQSPARVTAAIAFAHLAAAERDPEWRPRALLVDAAIDPLRSEQDILEAERLAPYDLDVLRARGLLALETGDAQAAQRVARRLAPREDLRAADLVVLAAIEREAGSLDDALRHARAAVRLDRSAWSAWAEVARAESLRGNGPNAQEALGVAQRLTVYARGRSRAAVTAASHDLDLNVGF